MTNPNDSAAGGEGDAEATPEVPLESLEAELDELNADLEAPVDATADDESLREQLDERTEDLKRVSAEYTNYRRRSERERQSAITAAKASVVAELLPVADDLALARQHGDLESGPLKSFSEKFLAALNATGAESFGEDGEAFNPELHEAVQDTSTGDEKVIGQVLRPGFRLGDRTIRTAMVIIADPA